MFKGGATASTCIDPFLGKLELSVSVASGVRVLSPVGWLPCSQQPLHYVLVQDCSIVYVTASAFTNRVSARPKLSFMPPWPTLRSVEPGE